MIPKKFNNKIPRPSKSRESQNSVTIDSPLLTPGYLMGRKLLEVISKPQIRFKGKAQADRESRCFQHTWVCEHLSEVCAAPYPIKSDANPACGATQPLGLRWGFETTSIHTAEPASPGTALFQEWSCRYSRPGRGTFSPEAGGSPK